MCLRMYDGSDPQTANMISYGGAMTQPEEASVKDADGERSEEVALYLATEQTKLSQAITDPEATQIYLAHARFADPLFLILLCESEKMKVTSGGGTSAPTVIRGWAGTTKATHAVNTPVYAAYDFTDITLQCNDNYGTDESSWMEYALDSGGSPGTYGSNVQKASLLYGATWKIWRKFTIPAGTGPQRKTDLEHLKDFTALEAANP